MAVAAKISAARALARKLSEEKQAAVAAARAAAEHSLDEEEIDRCPLIDLSSNHLGEKHSLDEEEIDRCTSIDLSLTHLGEKHSLDEEETDRCTSVNVFLTVLRKCTCGILVEMHGGLPSSRNFQLFWRWPQVMPWTDRHGGEC